MKRPKAKLSRLIKGHILTAGCNMGGRGWTQKDFHTQKCSDWMQWERNVTVRGNKEGKMRSPNNRLPWLFTRMKRFPSVQADISVDRKTRYSGQDVHMFNPFSMLNKEVCHYELAGKLRKDQSRENSFTLAHSWMFVVDCQTLTTY